MKNKTIRLKARLATEIGTRISLRRHWGDNCPSCLGGKSRGYHNAEIHVYDIPLPMYYKDAAGKEVYNRYGGQPKDYPDNQWPTECDHCGTLVPNNAPRQIFNKRLYNTPSGELEPGCLFYAPWYDDTYWSNQTTPTLCAILPNGGHWVVDGRASNCTMPKDKTHRCWIRHGEPPNITVDKNGKTCQAGAGSILQGNYHGFLRQGYFT